MASLASCVLMLACGCVFSVEGERMTIALHSNNSKLNRLDCPSGFSDESLVTQVQHFEPQPPWLMFKFDETMPPAVSEAVGDGLSQEYWEGLINGINRLLSHFVQEDPSKGLPHDSYLETRLSTWVRGYVNMWHEEGLFMGYSMHVCPESTRKEFSIAADTKRTLAWTSYHINMVRDTQVVKTMHGTKLCCCRFITDPVKHPCQWATNSGGAKCCKYKYGSSKCKHKMWSYSKMLGNEGDCTAGPPPDFPDNN